MPWGASDRAFFIVLIAFLSLVGFSFAYDLTSDTADLSEAPYPTWGLMTVLALEFGTFLAVAFILGPFKHRVHISMLGFGLWPSDYGNSGTNGFPFQSRMILVALFALISINISWTLLIHALSWDLLPVPEYPFIDKSAGVLFLSMMAFFVVVVGPFAEEVFFRGYILPGLAHKAGTAGSLIISSMIFGFAHVTLSTVIPTFVMGLVLGLLYLRTRSVLSCTIAHGIVNGMAFMGLVMVGGS